MGEYAFRKTDMEEVKIGTCTSMYYMTLPQVFDVNYAYTLHIIEKGWFRPSLFSEKDIQVGDYESHQVDSRKTHFWLDFTEDDIKMFRENIGTATVQVPLQRKIWDLDSMNNGSGLYVRTDCAHGYNEFGETCNNGNAFYNGRQSDLFFIEMVGIRDKKIVFLITCAMCGKNFILSYDEFLRCKFYGNEIEKEWINNSIYNLQFGEHAEFWKNKIDFSLMKFIDSNEKKEVEE